MGSSREYEAGLRVPPSAEDAETAVLVAMLQSATAVSAATIGLRPDAFYRPVNRLLFESMLSLSERAEPIDATTVRNELRRRGDRALEVGSALLASLASGRGARPGNVEHYIRIVHEKWLKRRLLAATTEIQVDCYDTSSDVYELLDRAERRVFEIAERSTHERGLYTMKRLADETRQLLTDVRSRPDRPSGTFGVPSGFRSLDRLTGGFQKSDFVVVAARPAMGKSSLALSIARNAAVDHGIPTALFTLEMSPQQLMLRLLSAESQVDAHALRSGRVGEEQWGRVSAAMERVQGAPLFIEDAPGLGVMDLRARARMLKREHRIGLLIVDYLQLMQAPRAERREREISLISKSLKQLAKELDIPVVALSQLNRAVELRIEKRPLLSDLRESGAIEEDSDAVLFVHRPEYYGEKYFDDGESTEGVAEIIVAKHRNGPTGTARLRFQKEFARFANIDERSLSSVASYMRSASNG